jgi:organic hydroperoxide reductase OsmC/OhrA
MTEHHATIRWELGDGEFTYKTYTRDHTWTFEGGVSVHASAAPSFLGNAELVDPEEAFVASLSSCHMLTFLAFAAKKRLVVERYEDAAVGLLEANGDGRLAVTRVTLRPKIAFGGEAPSPELVAQLHERAHEQCFIANSVRTDVTVEAS